MQLSIIIVNYNVRHFLEQCLCSVQVAIKGISAEVIVVDNNSTDGSITYLQPLFPRVKWIVNTQNTGFAVANNQAVELATGEYILYLNPDTLLAEDCLHQCLQFMKAHPSAGATGIRMLDGSGRFLRESKRAFPSPLTSLFKLAGLASLFPTSKLFARYHLGHLPENSNSEVDVLAGAFIMVRRTVLAQTGAFDERFFMYGEDIDLSYRIQKGGWQNWYFSGSSIIHFKGESTKKGSLNYVRMFYQAMYLFVQKHYGGGRAVIFRWFIQVAIWLRAGLSAVISFIKWIGLPLLDAILVLLSLFALKYVWQTGVKPGMIMRPEIVWTAFPVFTILFIVAGSIAGLYQRRYKPLRTWYAMMAAIVINLAVYSLLSDEYRFSRGIVLFGGLLASVVILLFRYALLQAGALPIADEHKEQQQTLIAASMPAFNEVQQLLQSAGREERVLGRIAPGYDAQDAIGQLSHLGGLLKAIPIREIIFCIDEELTLNAALSIMQQHKKLRYAFHYHNSLSIIGSHSKDTSGEAVAAQAHFNLAQPAYRGNKRSFDIVASLLLLVLAPLHIFFMRKPLNFITNCIQVLAGKKTWIGYHAPTTELPVLKPGILLPNAMAAANSKDPPEQSWKAIDHWYAKEYSWTMDIRILLKGYRWLGS